MASPASPPSLPQELEAISPKVPSSPTSIKSARRPISTLTLPHESMESISRTTTVGLPVPEDAPTHHPFSAFYSHPQCIISSELPRPSLSQEPSSQIDLEKGLKPTDQASGRPSLCQQPSIATTKTAASSLSPPLRKSFSKCKDASYISVWPTCSEVQQRKKDLRRAKGCYFFRNLSRKQKILAKVCLAFLVLSIVTVIAVVISYKTGGLVWKSANNYGTIGK